ncbi:LodA/GoxA family CTQ-dependent oxidase [Bradyrhizobium roseum]|uniref:LodA/GoxA family CTQ-dependent oxidase n=1 Tax=Bradyrhizobium roseum TaxID=3056648 RepID=UPI00263884F9|nr:LodA/GoxA family CTQ-dependent oxidase [Bradyrhizobium roseus]WKA31324.1 LodA/GoxA family CTQ-dependent oxidase [Bradyrhizobium roseus]
MADDQTRQVIDCESDPIGAIKQMFVDMTMGPRLARGQSPARRPVFLKPHGVARARFIVNNNLPAELKVGLFAQNVEYPAWIRISSDTIPMLPDLTTTVGIGIKLFDVPGTKQLGNPTDQTHDFILQNHDVFFVDTAADMCAFTRAAFEGNETEYRKAHPVTDTVLKDMGKVVPSVLAVPYWSVLPYAFGSNRFVKYKLEPLSQAPADPETNDPNYLAIDLQTTLAKSEARFRFLVQFQTNDQAMPLDRATVRWSETDSVPIEVATLVIPTQDILARGQAEYGENLAIHPWRTLAEHAPQGSLSDARKVVYAASSQLRHNVNGVPNGEPLEPRPLEIYPPGRDTVIVKAKIHPALGVARVGNADDAYYFGPEVVRPPRVKPDEQRDSHGALKRQAARFRIYGYNRAGDVVSELTPDYAAINWKVELSNLKAAWYQFQIALDIPEAATAPPSVRRNKDEKDRQKLAILGGEKMISGRNAPASGSVAFEGRFYDQPVYLGELKTDEEGRLVVLGGRGKTGSIPGAEITTFANNDGWHDDVADGPVTATVSIGGRDIPVDPAWVVVAPPNYAPDLKGICTMYDALVDVFMDAGMLPFKASVSFVDDVLPIFERMAELQWVNAGYAAAFGHTGWLDFLAPANLARLADKSAGNKAFRSQIANSFRDYDKDGWSPDPWPWIYGDAMDIPFTQSPRQNSRLAKHQLLYLKRWAEGNFESDYPDTRPRHDRIEELSIAEQPAMLDRAALDYCLADVFHPGCEITWPMRHASMFMAPFRIRHRRADERTYPIGDVLSSAEALSFDGPLYGQRAGWLTRWMALPWHTDTASCRSQADYDPSYDPYVPTFWPARVPNQIITEAAYRTIMDATKPRAERIAAFKDRSDWITQTLSDAGYLIQIREMLDRFGNMGVVAQRDGLPNDPDIPEKIYVSDGRKPEEKDPISVTATVAGAPQRTVQPTGFIERLGRFPLGPTR